MSTAHDDASAAGASLAHARWKDSKLRSAIATLRDRRDDLDDSHRAQLRELAGPEGSTDDD